MDSIEFVYIDNPENEKFSYYNDIFNSSRVKKEHDIKPELKFEIDLTKIEDIIYKFAKLTKPRIPISEYIELNIVNDKFYYDNSFNWKHLLEYLQIYNITNNNNTNNANNVLNKSSASFSLNNLIKHVKKESTVLETKEIRHIITYPSLMLEMEAPIVLAVDKSTTIPIVFGYLYFMESDTHINIELIEVNNSYRNSNLCKRLISYLVNIKPNINKYSLLNVGGLPGYSCYTDAFYSLHFNGRVKRNKNDNANDNANNETNENSNNNIRKKQMNNLRLTIKQRDIKLNLSKKNNIETNKKFNGYMVFYKFK